MKKKALLRGLLGFPLGMAIGYTITIIISLLWAGGYYAPCVPQLVDMMGNEISAVILQAVLCGGTGAAFAAATVIWEIERWNIAKQTGIYFLVTAIAMLPVAYLANWMAHSIKGFFIYFGIFTIIFAIVWLIQYLIWKIRIRRLNIKIKE